MCCRQLQVTREISDGCFMFGWEKRVINPVFVVKFLNKIKSLYWNSCITSNRARAYPRFCSMKQLGVFPSWLVVSALQGISLGSIGHFWISSCLLKMSFLCVKMNLSMKHVFITIVWQKRTLVLTQNQPTTGNWPASNQFEVWVLFHSICFVHLCVPS